MKPLVEIEHIGYGKGGAVLTEDELKARAAGVDVLIVELDPVTRAVIEAAPHLMAIASCRGTPNNVDVAAATERRIPVLYTPGRNAVSVAELTLSLTLNLARNVLPAVACLQHNAWGFGPDSPFIKFRGTELYQKTLGIVGFGAIGREVAQRARALGMRVIVYDPYAPAESLLALDAASVSLSELMAASDWISLHAKVTPETRRMIGVQELAAMKRTAFLINTASAELVDQAALVRALRDKAIAGAGLDVFTCEPPQDDPLLELDNVLATPHIGGATSDVSNHQSVIVAQDVKRILCGDRPKCVYNLEVLG